MPPVSGNLLVTGATGRVGRLLRHAWSASPVLWQSRSAPDVAVLVWDFGPDLPARWPAGAVILHLAGVTRGSAADLAANVTLARALADAARRKGAAHVLFASTQAVYRPGPLTLTETTPPDPVSDYGRAKLAAEEVLAEGLAGSGTGLTCLRIGNIAGADALLGGQAASGAARVVLDPIAGQPMGPERSYIGALTLARVLAALVARAPDLPGVLNLAQPGAVAMGDLLDAAGLDWGFGPARDGAVPRVVIATDRLAALVPLPAASAPGLVAELRTLQGVWP